LKFSKTDLLLKCSKKPKKTSKSPPRGPGGGGLNFICLPEFLFIIVRSPCKNLKPYNNPFCGFE
jgi:hypothetical protein